jgi:hypothetical protein
LKLLITGAEPSTVMVAVPTLLASWTLVAVTL